ncbi:MAG: hypothetical protein QOH63_645 [Acidobacteriota bacterium]|nr:hypothetical protein [Acidobacteriota bacterium]
MTMSLCACLLVQKIPMKCNTFASWGVNSASIISLTNTYRGFVEGKLAGFD